MFKLAFVFLSLLCTVGLWAQTSNGSILGHVTDTSGGVLPNAQITLTDEQRNLVQTRRTDSSADFLFPSVPIGTYTISVTAPGFRAYTQQHIKVDVGQSVRIDPVVQVGEVSEQVVVEASAPLLHTASAAVSQVVNSEQIVDLPLNGRDFTQLAILSGEVIRVGTANLGGARLSVDGGRTQSSHFLLDGANNTETTYDGVRMTPSIDAIQEFRIESNAFSAEYGRSATVINVAIKSGTNALHGTAYEFLRNDKMDARNFFALSLPPYRQNQFGGSLGGPIRRNKLFFFGDYEGLRVRKGVTFNNQAADAAQRSGDYSASSIRIFDPLTIRANPTGSGTIKDQFPGNRIPDNRISSVAKFFLPFIPPPNFAGNRFVQSPSNSIQADQADARTDYTLNSKQSLFGRYSFVRKPSYTPGSTPFSGGNTVAIFSQNAMLSHTLTYSPNLLNEAHLTWSRAAFSFSPQGLGTNYTVQSGIKGFELTSQTYPGFPNLAITNYVGVNGLTFNPIYAWISGIQFTDQVTRIKGKHALKAGFDFYRSATPTLNNAQDRGNFSFNGGLSGDGFADFLLGYPTSVSRGFPRNMFGVRSTNYSFFVQDDWRVSPRLTLNYGLRYEVLPPQSWIRNVAASYDFLGLTKAPGKLALANDSEGRIDLTSQQVTAYNYPFVKDIVISAREAGIPDKLVYTNWKNFAPRFGLSWRPLGENTVIRAGFGMFFLLTQGIRSIGSGPINAPLQVDESLVVSTAVAPTNTIVDILPPFGLNFVQVGFSDFDPHQATPYVNEWNVAIQRQLFRSFAVEASYTGNSAHKLEYNQRLNVPAPGPGAIASRRPVPRFGAGGYLADIANSNYNSLKLRAEQRYSHGLTFLLTYVYGRALDINTGTGREQDPTNLTAEHARSDYDVQHRFIGSVIYDLPFGRGKPFLNTGGLANVVIGGWRVGSILTLRTGLPFTPSISGDNANTGTTQRPNRLGSGNLASPTIDRWFDVSAFAVAQQFTYGNSGRNILTSPGVRNLDLSVFKEVSIRESRRLQFRAEFFNFTNTPAFGVPITTINLATGGKIFTAGEPRDIQLALKLLF